MVILVAKHIFREGGGGWDPRNTLEPFIRFDWDLPDSKMASKVAAILVFSQITLLMFGQV